MRLTVTETERTELETAAAQEKRVRRWRRNQAVLLLAAAQTPATVALMLRCSVATNYNWAAAWRQEGVSGLHEGDHGRGQHMLEPGAEAEFMPLLRTELATFCAAVSVKTVRRALHRGDTARNGLVRC